MTTHTNTKKILVEELQTSEFSKLKAEHKGKILVDFYAPWCAPCKMLSPVIDQIAKDHEAVKVIKINADDNQSLMTEYGVRGIPTLLLLNEGEVVATQVGAATVKQVTDFVLSN